MPHAQIKDRNGRAFKLYYERHGKGEPLLLIRGLGRSARYWGPVLPLLSGSYETIVFDNRSIARSTAPPGLYGTPDLADDCAALLDVLGVPKTHVFGMSLGGMIAQEFALRHGSKVDRLILGATMAGGKRASRTPMSIITRYARSARLSVSERNRNTAALVLSPGTVEARPEILEAWDSHLTTDPISAKTLFKQALAGRRHNTWARLPSIAAPTLVVTGDADTLMPPANSNVLASRIPNAKLVLVPGAAHDLTTDRPEESADIVTSFLSA